MSRDLFPQDYHCLGDRENRPLKWMALETITLKQFSEASDIWAFSILIWEMFTLARQPYQDVSVWISGFEIDFFNFTSLLSGRCLWNGSLLERWLQISSTSKLSRRIVSFTNQLLVSVPSKIFLFSIRFTIMAYCWTVALKERPSFPYLEKFLQDFYNRLTNYI